MWYTYKNKKVYYVDCGKGPVMLLLHGFLGSHEIWKDYVAILSRSARVIAIDLPGHGLSDTLPGEPGIPPMADVVLEILNELQLCNIFLVGHSMGGYVALECIKRNPTLFEQILLVNSTSRPDSTERKEIRDRAKTLVIQNKKAYIRMAINNLMPPSQKNRFRPQIETLKLRAFDFPTDGILYALEAMKKREDRTETLKSFQGTKQIVVGEEDKLINLEEVSMISDTSSTVLVRVKGGHLSYLEAQDKIMNLCISSKK